MLEKWLSGSASSWGRTPSTPSICIMTHCATKAWPLLHAPIVCHKQTLWPSFPRSEQVADRPCPTTAIFMEVQHHTSTSITLSVKRTPLPRRFREYTELDFTSTVNFTRLHVHRRDLERIPQHRPVAASSMRLQLCIITPPSCPRASP